MTRGMLRLHYGWIVVGLTFIAVMIAAGIRSVTGVIMVPLEQEFAWSRSHISFAIGFNLALYGFLGPFVAAAMEQFGIRKMMLYAMSLLVIGITICLTMTQLWQFQVIWGVIISIGSGVFLTVLSATVANRWFDKRRGIVMGFLMASTAAGQMVFLPILAYLVEAYSWRMALAIFVGLGIMMIPVIALWMKDRPSDKGLVPYGAENNLEPQTSSTKKKNPIVTAFSGLGTGIRSGPFWLLASSFFLCGATTSGLIGTHFIPASMHHGIPEVGAASLFAFMGIFNMIGTIISGWLSDRYDNRWLLFGYYGVRSLFLFFLPQAFEMGSFTLLTIFAVLYGLDWIATAPPTIRLATDYYGKETGAIIYGWIFAAHQLGSGAAAFLGGYMYEQVHSYTITFLCAGVLCIVATLFVFGVKNVRNANPIRVELE